MIATRKMRWAKYVARMGRTMNLFAKRGKISSIWIFRRTQYDNKKSS